MTPAPREWINLLPERLDYELQVAADLGGQPVTPGTALFDRAIVEEGGRFKWVVMVGGGLVVIPFELRGVELAHTVASGGRPVWAAGEAHIAGNRDLYFGIDLSNRSGHYQPDSMCLHLARVAFRAFGIEFPP